MKTPRWARLAAIHMIDGQPTAAGFINLDRVDRITVRPLEGHRGQPLEGRWKLVAHTGTSPVGVLGVYPTEHAAYQAAARLLGVPEVTQ